MTTAQVLAAVAAERTRQTALHGDQSHLPYGTGAEHYRDAADTARECCDMVTREDRLTFRHILTEEFWEVLAESDPAKLYVELIQLAAVCVQMAEAVGGRKS